MTIVVGLDRRLRVTGSSAFAFDSTSFFFVPNIRTQRQHYGELHNQIHRNIQPSPGHFRLCTWAMRDSCA